MSRNCWLAVGLEQDANELRYLNGCDLTGKRGRRAAAREYIDHFPNFCTTIWLGRTDDDAYKMRTVIFEPVPLYVICGILDCSREIKADLILLLVAALLPQTTSVTDQAVSVQDESVQDMISAVSLLRFLQKHKGKVLAHFWM